MASVADIERRIGPEYQWLVKVLAEATKTSTHPHLEVGILATTGSSGKIQFKKVFSATRQEDDLTT